MTEANDSAVDEILGDQAMDELQNDDNVEDDNTDPESQDDSGDDPEEDQEDDEEVEDSDEDEDDEDDEGESEEDDTDEFAFGDNKFKVKKGSMSEEEAARFQDFGKGLLKDHTQKTQLAAELHKTVEAREKSADKMLALTGQKLKDFARANQLSTDLAQIEEIDMDQLWETAPDKARQIDDLKRKKLGQYEAARNKVAQNEHEINTAHQAEFKRRNDEGEALIEGKIKGFTKDIAPKVVDYVVSKYGLPKEFAETWRMNVPGALMAYKAMQFDEMQDRLKKTKQSGKNKQPKNIQPLKTGKRLKPKAGKSTKKPGDMDPQEYAKKFAAGKIK